LARIGKSTSPGRRGRRGCWRARRYSAACRPPIEALTLTFLNGQVQALLVVSDDEDWERIACGEAAAEDARFEHRERTFSAAELPESPDRQAGRRRGS
jgi:hypothetical protein